jgi:hypothetical protein
MNSAPSPSAPRGLCAWSAITIARALNVCIWSTTVFFSSVQGVANVTQNLDHFFFLEELQDARP